MSGSLSYQKYTTDGGVSYSILCDRSNALAVNASATATPGSLPPATLPRNIKPRYALFSDSTGTIKRRVPILTLADLTALAANASFVPGGETATVNLTYVRGEATRVPHLTDTGRTN
jgi:hypothetical protein